MEIVQCTSYANSSPAAGRGIKYIVVHYTAGSTSRGGTARNVAKMFSNPKQGASADFIVDDVEAVQFNPDIRNRYTWHCGGTVSRNQGAKLNGIATNGNSIGIEMCSTNVNWKATDMPNTNKWSFTSAVVNNTIELVKKLMAEYNIPASNVIRHYDCTGKLCPGIIGWNEDSGDISAWLAFKAALEGKSQQQEEEEMTKEQFAKMSEEYTAQIAAKPASAWAEDDIAWAQSMGILRGDDKGNLMPLKPITRQEMCALLHRLYVKIQEK